MHLTHNSLGTAKELPIRSPATLRRGGTSQITRTLAGHHGPESGIHEGYLALAYSRRGTNQRRSAGKGLVQVERRGRRCRRHGREVGDGVGGEGEDGDVGRSLGGGGRWCRFAAGGGVVHESSTGVEARTAVGISVVAVSHFPRSRLSGGSDQSKNGESEANRKSQREK